MSIEKVTGGHMFWDEDSFIIFMGCDASKSRKKVEEDFIHNKPKRKERIKNKEVGGSF